MHCQEMRDRGGMMAVMLTQVPLPWLPGDAEEIAPGVGVVPGADGGGVVWVHGLATFAWDCGDEAARRLAAVQLVRLRAAARNRVAAAFGTDPVTVWRWDRALRQDGVAGLVPARKGPRGAWKLTPELAERIRELDAGGRNLTAIAAECGVSTFTVRAALGRVPARRGEKPAAAEEPAAAEPPAPAAEEPAAEPAAPAAGDPAAEEPAVPAAEEPAAEGGPAGGELVPVLPDPSGRGRERALARFGLLGEGAAPVFVPGARYPLAGLLLALPALDGTGLLACARAVYGPLRNGFYGLDTMLVLGVFQALLREPRAEGAARIDIGALGRVLGLDRAPEVKTIRRKLGELAAAGKAADLQMAIARRHAAARPDELGFMYIDGHTRAYFGKRDVQKMHVSRLKFPGPATDETWVTDGAGDPMLVVMAEPAASLAGQIRGLLPRLRVLAGEGRRVTLCFDRGGWSPDLFADIIDAGFDLLTYRKNDTGKDLPALPGEAFAAAGWTGDDGRPRSYDLAETTVGLTIRKGKHKGRVLSLRQVTRRKPGPGGTDRQAHILTTRPAGELPAPAVIYRMTSRWREENYFRYARTHFALDAMDSYAAIPDDPGRLVPNPAKKTAAAAVKTARKALTQAGESRERKLAALHSPAAGTSIVITNKMLARLDAPVETARARLEDARAAAKATPAKIPLGQHNPGQVRLDTETKLITHAIRMAACNAETILARALHGHYARAGDEAFALIREALTVSGDIIPAGGILRVRLDPLTAPRHTRALAALCHELSATATRYPGTALTLHYEVKETSEASR
jgi:transposase-like protein